MNKLTKYLEQFALISLEKQDKLASLLGDYTYVLDLESGKIRFSDNIDVTFQVLGTESDNTLIWLWAWADEQTEDVPTDLLRVSRELRDWGSREGVQEFILPAVDLHRADGHVLSMIACELGKASCYFRDSYDGGSAFYLLYDKVIDAQPLFDLSRLSRWFLDLVSRYEINHRNALLAYFRFRGLSYEENGDAITCDLDSGERLSAEFDHAGHLTHLNGDAILTVS
jgi:hypothetical protein